MSVKENTDPVFYCKDLAYLQAVGGHIYLNNDYLNPISEEDCVIDAEKNTMTLKGLVLTPGLHTLELRAPGYQTVRLTFQSMKKCWNRIYPFRSAICLYSRVIRLQQR